MSGKWITVDGLEGVGKSTLASALSNRFGVVSIPEFSDACFGVVLEQAVRHTPHVISRSAIGQSLVFLGDFFEIYESAILPRLARGEVVISDRGPFSKWLYQTVVLEPTLGIDTASVFVRSIVNLVRRPDVMIYLDCPLDILRRRLELRDGSCDDARMEFIKRCDVIARDEMDLWSAQTDVIHLDSSESIDTLINLTLERMPVL